MIVPQPAQDEAGLTLVEMLVVLAIVGVMAGAVMLGIGSGDGRGAETEARRLAARLDLAADEAMVTGRTIGFVAQRDGYRFVTWRDGAWRDDTAPSLEPHALPAALMLDGAAGTAPVVIGADGGGSALTLRIVGAKGNGWTIAFDGVQSTASAGG